MGARRRRGRRTARRFRDRTARARGEGALGRGRSESSRSAAPQALDHPRTRALQRRAHLHPAGRGGAEGDHRRLDRLHRHPRRRPHQRGHRHHPGGPRGARDRRHQGHAVGQCAGQARRRVVDGRGRRARPRRRRACAIGRPRARRRATARVGEPPRRGVGAHGRVGAVGEERRRRARRRRRRRPLRHALLGTIVSAGTGTAIVTGTGPRTEIGRIQTMISEVETLETPLTKTLASFGTKLAYLILGATVILVLVGWLVYQWDFAELVSAAIGFAVAAVPEGLPALVTITLALGVQQMARRNAITRKLAAVETLGSVSTICSDKTGTLTKNEMTARVVRTAAHEYSVSGAGYAPHGTISIGDAGIDPAAHAELAALIEVMSLCNDARVEEDGGQWRLVGEPTEGSLRVLGMKAGFDRAGWERIAVIPFESENKYMAVLVEPEHIGADARAILVKGAPDRVLDRCTSQTAADGSREPIDRAFWEAQIDEIGDRGLRVLAAARKPAASGASEVDHDDIETGLELIGLVGIVDPPRPEAIDAIAICKSAGIRVKMITGDHAGTALAIGREMGIAAPGTKVLTGAELEAMDDDELRAVVRDVDVYARTSPEHKIRIVSALQHHGEVVAMTGDGVNDAPALTQADVGVAMGIKGTDATKEAAEVVLADDNFATIERAVEEGRRIYDNLRKSLLFLLPTNGAQSLVILIAVLAGLALPLAPVQVLWINMVTGVTLSLALANERAEHDIMDRKPRDVKAGILSAAAIRRIIVVSILIGGAALGVFYFERGQGAGMAEAQTTAVTMLATGQLAYLFNCRFLDRSGLTFAVFRGNVAVWWSTLALVVLQLVFVYAPFMHDWFRSAPIGIREWGLTIALAIVIFLLVELVKWLGRVRERSSARRLDAVG
ncbi:HAD-IC family P-type ATPase [Agromyces protaetiae]|uniref:HAD-IC family P-type ATPase n=1 Tax=Agromyces protaetiae TaxID=2509455 RepID=UPI00312CA95E